MIRDLWRSYLSIRRGQFDHIRNDRRISQTICVLEALFVATVVITNAVLFSELVARAEMERNLEPSQHSVEAGRHSRCSWRYQKRDGGPNRERDHTWQKRLIQS